MVDYDTRKALDDIAFDLQWVATYIEDIEIMREKIRGLAEYILEIIAEEEAE